MTARDVAAIVEAWAPLSIQETWDNSGFCVGSPQTDVTGVMLALDVTLAVVEEALAVGANMIVSHHPLIFHGLKQICGEDTVSRVVTEAIKNDIVIYSVHTNADKVATGVSGIMAEMLHLQQIQIIHPDPQPASETLVGLGLVGNLPEPQEVHSFLRRVKEVFDLSCLRTGPVSVPVIRRVAVCGGSGASIIPQALKSEADIFLCGELGYHHFFSMDGTMMMADMGHYESEIGIIRKLASLLSEKNLTFAVFLTKHSTNPIHYF